MPINPALIMPTYRTREKHVQLMIRVFIPGRAGYSLVELLAVIIIVGVIATMAMKSLTSANTTVRVERTCREMDRLAHAVAGDPDLVTGGTRSDYGYVGDVGSLPPDLDALVANPGGLSTWDGPYVNDAFSTDGSSSRYGIDAWGHAYTYSGGIAIVSDGGGTSITRQIAHSVDDLVNNNVRAVVMDLDFTSPGTDNTDSVTFLLTYPDGFGSTATDTRTPEPDGFVEFDSIPIGQHTLRMVYEPDNDTISRVVNVSPGEDYYAEIQYYRDVWAVASGGGGSLTLTLRPTGAGSITNLSGSGCASNYQCVDEVTSDGDATNVNRPSNTYGTDIYEIEDPSTTGSIAGITVYCRARKGNVQGNVMPTVYTGSTEYNGTAQSLTGSYADYGHQWTTNPNTGVAWSWSDITSLQAGVRLRGQNGVFPAYCTQVWVEVSYGP